MSKCSARERLEAQFSAMPHFQGPTQVSVGDGRTPHRQVRVGFDAEAEWASDGINAFADGYALADEIGGGYD